MTRIQKWSLQFRVLLRALLGVLGLIFFLGLIQCTKGSQMPSKLESSGASAPITASKSASTGQYSRPSVDELKKKLTPSQYRCTQESETEKPFANEYWNHKALGIYVDVVSGEPLFSSLDKYDSGSGWPSFTRSIDDTVKTVEDRTLGMVRIEIKSKSAGSHLGHVFDDGPGPTHQRFCVNSAALRFVPVEKMKQEGYGRYLFSFAEAMHLELATLAGGCYWGVDELLRKLPGVVVTQVGFTGGVLENATYDEVKKGQTGHAESVMVLFDPLKLTYEKLLLEFFRLHNPTTKNQQGNDVGSQYRSAIFYHSEAQKKVAQAVIDRVEKSHQWPGKVRTEVVGASKFWRALEEHQDYLEKNPNGYTCHYYRKFSF